MTTRKIIAIAAGLLLILGVLLLALCPKPNPGKPVPAAVDIPTNQAQD